MRLIRGLAVPLLLCVLAGCRAPSLDADLRTKVLAQVGQRVTQEAYADRVDFGTWPRVVAAHRPAIEAARDPEAFATQVNKALDTFKVSHLRLRTPEAAKERERNRMAATLGFMPSLQEGRWVVFRVLLDGPAWRAGLRAGDVLDLPAEKTPAEAFKGLGAHHVAWHRDGVAMAASMSREPVPMESGASLSWLRRDVACLRVPSFRKGLYDPAQTAALVRKAWDAEVLVLDLRTNGGGLLDYVAHFLGLFLPSGTPLYCPVARQDARMAGAEGLGAPELARRLGRWVKARTFETGPYRGRLLVLVDPLNGSGGELAPAILQDHHRAEVAGMKTPGAVLGSQDRKLAGGWECQLPLMEVVTAGGRSLEGRGVLPEHVLAPRVLVRDAELFPALLQLLDRAPATRTGEAASAPRS